MINNLLKNILSFCFFLLIFGCIYQPKSLGYVASSPGSLLILLLSPFLFLKLIFSRKLNIHSKLSLAIIIYGLINSIISLLIFGDTSFFFYKTGSLLLLSIVWLSPILFIDYIDLKLIKKYILLSIVIMFLSILFNYFGYSFENSILFSDDYKYTTNRPRGFSSESSTFSVILIRYILIYYLIINYNKIKYSNFFYFLIILIFLSLFLESKGATLSILLASFFILFYKFKIRNLVPIILVLIAGIIATLITSEVILAQLDDTTTVPTRIGLIFVSVIAFVYNPFGYGYYGFYPALNLFGIDIINLLNVYNANTTELNDILINFNNMSSKSTLFDSLVIYGIFFIIFIVKILKDIAPKDDITVFILAYLLFSSLTTSANESISFYLVLACLLKKRHLKND